MSDNWEVFLRPISETQIQSHFVNLDMHDTNNRQFPTLCRFRVSDIYSKDEILPDDAAREKINKIEERIIQLADADPSVNHLGRISADGGMTVYLLVESKSLPILDMIKQLFPQGLMTFANDPDGKIVDEELMPNMYESLRSRNMSVIVELQSHGDDSEVPRQVDHVFVFENGQSPEPFMDEARSLGYTRLETSREEDMIIVEIQIEHACTPEVVDKISLKLADLANRHNVEYDGWAAMLVKRKSFWSRLKFW